MLEQTRLFSYICRSTIVRMGQATRIYFGAVTSFAAIALCVIAYKLVAQTGTVVPTTAKPTIDYTNMVVILLTTVTVIFSVCALALTVVGVIGFRSLKGEAGKFASQQAMAEIASAFDEGGRAHEQIQDQFIREDGHLLKWAERRIRIEVISLLPLVIDRIQDTRSGGSLDDGTPTDEGRVD